MLRIVAVAGAALSKLHFLRSISTRKSSLVLSHRTHLPILPISLSRLYARMAWRSPPAARRNADENEESESEPETEEEADNAMEFDLSDDDDGGESEEWEGFVMDFGALGKKKDDDDQNKEGSSS